MKPAIDESEARIGSDDCNPKTVRIINGATVTVIGSLAVPREVIKQLLLGETERILKEKAKGQQGQQDQQGQREQNDDKKHGSKTAATGTRPKVASGIRGNKSTKGISQTTGAMSALPEARRKSRPVHSVLRDTQSQSANETDDMATARKGRASNAVATRKKAASVSGKRKVRST